MEGNGRGGENVKGKEGEVEGGIWPTQKFGCGAPYAAECFLALNNWECRAQDGGQAWVGLECHGVSYTS